jgi:hypothetical protein
MKQNLESQIEKIIGWACGSTGSFCNLTTAELSEIVVSFEMARRKGCDEVERRRSLVPPVVGLLGGIGKGGEAGKF